MRKKQQQNNDGLNGFNNKLTLALGGFNNNDGGGITAKNSVVTGEERKRTIITVDKKKKDGNKTTQNTDVETDSGLRKKDQVKNNSQDSDTKVSQLSQSLAQALNGNGGGEKKEMKPKTSALPQGL